MTWMIVDFWGHNEWAEDDNILESKCLKLCEFLKENNVEYGSFNEGSFDQIVIINLDPDTDYQKIAEFIVKNLEANPRSIHLVFQMNVINGAGELEVMDEILENEVLKALRLSQTSIDYLKQQWRKSLSET